jgi:hypothetical protein
VAEEDQTIGFASLQHQGIPLFAVVVVLRVTEEHRVAGAQGRGLDALQDQGEERVGDIGNGDEQLADRSAPPGPGAVNPRRYYAAQAPNLTTLAILRSAGRQDYNAMHLAFARRSRGGLTLSANYTLTKGMSDVTQPGGGGAQQAYGVDPTWIHELEWGPSDIDIRHRYAVSINYELPFGRESTGALKQLIADWQVNLMGYWQSGVPFTVFNTTARSNTGAGQDRPNQTLGVLDNPTVTRWFDTTCFVGQEINAIGNSGRNNLYGPPQRRMDASIFKDVVVGPRRLQLRLEVFNLTNTPSFAVPDGGLGSATVGRITSTANNVPRQFQFAAKFLF